MNPIECLEKEIVGAVANMQREVERAAIDWISDNAAMHISLDRDQKARIHLNCFADDSLEKTGLDLDSCMTSITAEELARELIAYRKKHDDEIEDFIEIAESLEAAAKLLRAEVDR